MGCNKSKDATEFKLETGKGSPDIIVSFVPDSELDKQKEKENEEKDAKATKTENNASDTNNSLSSTNAEAEHSNSDTHRRHTVNIVTSASCLDLSTYQGNEENKEVPSLATLSSDYNTVYTESEYNRLKNQDWNPSPSAGVSVNAHKSDKNSSSKTSKATNNNAELALFRFVCAAVNDRALSHRHVSNFHFHRAYSLTSAFQDAFFQLLCNAGTLHRLDLSGNSSGPVAIKALLLSLSKSDVVRNLDISDNMTDSDCSEALMKVLKTSECLEELNLSGNQLGKESLSKRLCDGLENNRVLQKLNISNCGAINLNGLFEGVKKSLSASNQSLTYLNISNNEVSNGHQLGESIASVLEHPCCSLSFLSIENTGIDPLGWSAVVGSLKKNKSLREFRAGGFLNKLESFSQLADILMCNGFITILNLSGINVQEKHNQDSSIAGNNKVTTNLALTDINLANCDLSDSFFVSLAQIHSGRLSNLTKLNFSNNSNLTANCFVHISKLLNIKDKKQVQSLFLAGLNLNEMLPAVSESFSDLKLLSLSKSRISLLELSKLPQMLLSLTDLRLDGIKLGKSDVLSRLLSSTSPYHLTNLSLRGCSIMDADLNPVVSAFRLKGPVFDSLKELDLSVNRIAHGLRDLSTAFVLSHPCLELLNVSQNEILDDGACALAEFLSLKDSEVCLKTLNISQNNLNKRGLLALMSTVGSKLESCGITSLDVSSQKSQLNEDDLEDVIEALTAAIGLDPELALQNAEQPMPSLSHDFNVNLTNLGGTAGPRAMQLDCVAVKTDFSKLCNVNPSLSDYLLISSGLRKKPLGSPDSHMFTSDEWRFIVGSDAPAWLMVESERQKSVYINHLPGSATSQRLHSILEMEADCAVAEIVFVKDPIFFKQSGAAWVLFDDATSVQQAVEFYARGEAQMFGSSFTISTVLVSVSEVSQKVKGQSEREKKEREAQRKLQEKNDQAMMEANQQLAEERAAYREAHPAYQNGRIW